MMRPVRFAVVGVTGYSRSHLYYIQALEEAGQARLVASMMIDKADHPDAVAEFESRGIRVYDRYDEMLTQCHGQVDLVTLPVPIYLHAPMAIAAFEAGYHVLVEKPAAGSVADVDAMIAARKASDRRCAVGFQQIYSDAIQTLKRAIVEGRLGQVRRISTMALWPRNPTYYGRNDWAGKLYHNGKAVYDSPFNNALAHQVMNMLFLASPEPGRAAYPAQTEAELFRAYDIESFDTGCMRVQTDTGVEVLFVATHACESVVDPVMRLEAERGTVHCRIEESATIEYAGGTSETIPWSDSRTTMFQNILDAVTYAVPEPLCTLELARAQVACTEAIHRAAPIRSVPPQYVSVLEEGQRVIQGIAQAVQGAFASGKLFSEIGVPFISSHPD